MIKHSRRFFVIAMVLLGVMVLYPNLLDAAESQSAQIRFSREGSTTPFTLYILHEGKPTRVQAPEADGQTWPQITLYPDDSVTLISNRDIPSCTNRVVRLETEGISWENPRHGVIGCDKVDWLASGTIIVTDDF